MARTRQIDTQNEYLGKAEAFSIDEIGSGEAPDIEVIDRIPSSSKAERMAFMMEPVTVMVHESTDPNDTDLVQVSINGRTQFLLRGKPQTVKRCYVERLARAKKTAYSQNLDERLGEAMNTMRPHHALLYPFSVIEDKNPKGGEWLRTVLAERV